MAKIQHVLPPMAQNTHLQQLDTAGRWEPVADNSLLINIARGLRVVSKHESDRYLVSIPDVWARTELVNLLCSTRSTACTSRLRESGGSTGAYRLVPLPRIYAHD